MTLRWMGTRMAPISWLLICWLGVSTADLLAAAPNAQKTAAELDRLWQTELKVPATSAAEPADDETFFRRAWLDLAGDLPSPTQTIAFTLDPSTDKRTKLVDRLLTEEGFARNWARYWRDVILSHRTEERALLVSDPLVTFLTDAFKKNRPWDEVATDFITAEGDVREVGQTAIILAQDGQTEDTAAEVSRIFLGIQIQCAQCHDHVTDRWKRTQFHEFAAFFPRVAARPQLQPKRTIVVSGDDFPSRQVRKMNGRRGIPEHYMPDLQDPTADGTRMQPEFFLTGAKIPFGTKDAERRGAAAKFITENEWFAKAMVNRIWSELCGEGFYTPVDDIGPDRTPLAPQTLELLSKSFIESGYDVRWLYRTITSTAAYQRASRPRRTAEQDPQLANCPQRLRADQLSSSLLTALDLPWDEGPSGLGQGPRNRRPASKRAQFASLFGYDPSQAREEIAGTIPQALLMMNGPGVNGEISARSSNTMLGRLATKTRDDEQVIEELYLRCLARIPSQTEMNTCLNYIKTVKQRDEALEDILWSLLNSTEFLHRK